MSVMGYFEKRDAGQLRMRAGKDSLGIVWSGPVVEGRLAAGEALRRSEVDALLRVRELEELRRLTQRDAPR